MRKWKLPNFDLCENSKKHTKKKYGKLKKYVKVAKNRKNRILKNKGKCGIVLKKKNIEKRGKNC